MAFFTQVLACITIIALGFGMSSIGYSLGLHTGKLVFPGLKVRRINDLWSWAAVKKLLML